MNYLSLRSIRYTLFQCSTIQLNPEVGNLIQARCYAARKGTREKKKKAKVKVEIQKVGFIPHNQRNREKFLASRPKLKFDDSLKSDPTDDVFICKYYKWIKFPFQEAVKAHRETHHPEMYNRPNVNLNLTIELNMEGEKKNRLLDNFSRIVSIPHKFDHGEIRSVAAFCKNPEDQKIALNAGAQIAGGVDMIKKIQNGEISLADFKYVVAHPEILPELVVLRGLLKNKFPNPKIGNLDVDLESAVHKFLHGINYAAVKDEYEKDYGSVNTFIGTLNMDSNHLEKNFAALIKDVYTMKPKRQGFFITRCILWTNYSPERLKIDHEVYLSGNESVEKNDEEEDTEHAMKL